MNDRGVVLAAFRHAPDLRAGSGSVHSFIIRHKCYAEDAMVSALIGIALIALLIFASSKGGG